MPAAEMVTDEPEGTPTNADNLFAAGKQPASVIEEPTIFLTKSTKRQSLEGRRRTPLYHRPI